MSTDIRARLDAMQARADAATEGPWEADGGEVTQHWSRPEPWRTVVGTEVSCMSYCYGGTARGVETEADAEFIAHTRQDLPALLAFARDVLDLHAREVIAVHEWGPEAWCSTCQHHWPCDTAALATRHLGGGFDD